MGELVEIGSENKKLRVGDRVVVPFTVFGHTTAGLYGYTHLMGGYCGGQAEYVRVPYADVAPIKIPDGIDDEKVLFLSDIFPTGWLAAVQCDIEPTDTVARALAPFSGIHHL